jgi:hypothetical protein
MELLIAALRECQLALGTGYIGGVPNGVALWQEIDAGRIEAQTFDLNGRWVPLYNLHKVLTGVVDAAVQRVKGLSRLGRVVGKRLLEGLGPLNGRALAAKHGMNAPARGENDYDSAFPGGSPSYGQPGLPQYQGNRQGGYGGGGGTDEAFTPEVEAQLQRISSTVTAYIANMSDTLLKAIPKAVIHLQVLQAKTLLLEPLYKQVGGITDEQLRLLLGDDPETAARRELLLSRTALLRKAQDEIMSAI